MLECHLNLSKAKKTKNSMTEKNSTDTFQVICLFNFDFATEVMDSSYLAI